MKRQITLTLLPIGLVIFCLTFGHITIAAPGDLDPTFSGDGKLTDGIAYGNDGANAVALQSDGKIVAAGFSWNGSNYHSSLVRYNTNGSLDTSFDSDGKVITPNGWANFFTSIAIQSDGRIVAAGISFNGSDDGFELIRYNTNGSLDTSFGVSGTVEGDFEGTLDKADAVAIQSDGKIVVAGYTGSNGSDYDFKLVRYNTNGSIDTSFDGDGKVTTDFGSSDDYANSVAIQPDGKIVAAGYSSPNGSNNDFAFVRYNTNGSLDTSFGVGGKVTTDFGGAIDDYVESVAIQSDGKIVAAGNSWTTLQCCSYDFALARYNPDGSLDTSFDGDGKVRTPIGASAAAYSVAIQTDGRIVAAGNTYPDSGSYFALARYNTDGSLDTSLNSDGKVITGIGTNDYINSVVIQSDGKIVAAGSSGSSSSNTTVDFALARYNPNGSLDASFDFDGKVTTDFEIFADNRLDDVAIQQDGKIVTVGTGLSRYDPDGSPDTTFGNAGKVDQGGSAVAIQSDGKILVTGENTLARYNPNGTLDKAFGNGSGTVLLNLGPSGASTSAAIQSDGKILIAGYYGFEYCIDPKGTCGGNYTQDFLLARYNANGSVDTSFGSEGKVITDVGVNSRDHDYAHSVVIQTDGKIVVAGDGDGDFALIRYNPNGSLDASFGGGGIVVTQIEGVEGANSMTIQPDGKIIAAGYSYNTIGSIYGFVVTRYNMNGSLDATFDGDGKVITPILGTGFDGADSVAIQPDGKIVAAGSGSGTNYDFALTRYNPNGSLDNTFSGDGISTVNFNGNSDDRANGMALDGQGRAVVVGSSDGAFAIARFNLGPGAVAANNAPFDYDGDGSADLSVFRPSDGMWWIRQPGEGFTQQQWGNSTDRIAPADYDGDGKTDIAVYRPSEGNWYVLSSLTSTYSIQQWGDANDVIVPGDYTGDGKADHAVWRPSSGEWFVRDISNGQFTVTQWGVSTDTPVPSDYDGNGTFDIMAYRPSEGNWYRHSSGAVTQWGDVNDKLVPADYNGDGSADLAVWRPSDGNWYIKQPGGGFDVVQWGASTDIVVPADYDGNGETNIAIWRPSDGIWYILNYTGGGFTSTQWGSNGDRPTPNAYVR